MAEVIDIVHNLNFEVDANPVQVLNKEFGTQLKQLQDLSIRQASYSKQLAATSADNIRRTTTLNALLERNRRQYDAVSNSIAKQVDGSQKLTRSVNQLAVNTNGVGVAFANIVRDAPYGIIGVGNNITQVFDSASIAFKQFREQGLTAGQAFAKIGASFFSLNTALSLGITLLTVFGDKIFSAGNKSGDAAGEVDTLTQSILKQIDAVEKYNVDVENTVNQGLASLKRETEAIRAKGVANGEVFAARQRDFNAEQGLREKEAQDLQRQLQDIQKIQTALGARTERREGDLNPDAPTIEEALAFAPAGLRDDILRLGRDERISLEAALSRKVTEIQEKEKDKRAEIETERVAFTAKQVQQEYELRINLINRIAQAEAEFTKLRLQRGAETFTRIQEQSAIELQEAERKLNLEIEAARKEGVLTAQIQARYEDIRVQLRKDANERLIQENIDFFNQEREDLEEVIASLDAIFALDPRAKAAKKQEPGATLTRIPVDDVTDDLERSFKKQEQLRKRNEKSIEESLEYTFNTTISTLQSIYDAQLFYLDKELAVRRDRVDQAVLLAEKGNTDILEAEKQRLQETESERERVAQRQLQLNALLQASSAALAATQAIQTVTNAGATGDPYSTAARIAAAVAALAAGFAFVTNLTQAFKFKDGVIGLQGEGTETSDSIPARLSKGESVMTAAETKKYRPYLEAMRDGTFLNMVAKTSEPVVINQRNDYSRLEKKLDGVIEAIGNSKVVAKQVMDKNGLSQAIETYKKHERSRWA